MPKKFEPCSSNSATPGKETFDVSSFFILYWLFTVIHSSEPQRLSEIKYKEKKGKKAVDFFSTWYKTDAVHRQQNIDKVRKNSPIAHFVLLFQQYQQNQFFSFLALIFAPTHASNKNNLLSKSFFEIQTNPDCQEGALSPYSLLLHILSGNTVRGNHRRCIVTVMGSLLIY